MKNNLTELVFILDRSGSMSGLEKDTIGGFNSMLDVQREVEGEALISTVLFDDKIEVLHDRESLKNIKNLTGKDYTVRGCTALLDAIGRSIKHINRVQKEMPKEERPVKTMFVITTDGQENSSHEYTYEKIKKMVEKKQEKKNWEFIFLGANMDAISAAADIGIKAKRASNFHCDSIGTEVNFRALGKAVANFRRADIGDVEDTLEDWDDEIERDYTQRSKS